MSNYGTSVNGNAAVSYAVDIVFVIDITGSMNPVIDNVKNAALSFHDDLERVMAEKDKSISNLRVRVVAFRDFLDNEGDALRQSPFYSLPAERAQFDAFVRGLRAGGGGDAPESGLEGLGVALRSDWERGMDRRRHLIILFTDAPAHALEKSAHLQSIPAGTPRSMDQLFDAWEGDGQTGGMEHSAKRLLLYAPDLDPWNTISEDWQNTLHFPSRAGEGLDDYTFDEILNQIASSV
jgi:hypothetical protein